MRPHSDLRLLATWWNYERTMTILRCSMVVLFGVLLADPRGTISIAEDTKYGLDIALVLDISKSMLAEDLNPNRIEAAKKVIEGFVENVTSDRVGIVVFAGKPFVSIPLTFDYSAIISTIRAITTDTINQNAPGLAGTAIGDGMLVAIDSLTSRTNGTAGS
jgi:Ca-activated chloride channel homolog